MHALDGDALAATDLGKMYAHGSNSAHERPRRCDGSRRGADLGSDEARRELGLLLLNGEGTSKGS